MLIPVIYLDGKHDMVKDFYLTELINQRKILSFKRSDGWVSITSPLVRRNDSLSKRNGGPERRRIPVSVFSMAQSSLN